MIESKWGEAKRAGSEVVEPGAVRSIRPTDVLQVAITVVLAVALLVGCGSDDEPEAPAAGDDIIVTTDTGPGDTGADPDACVKQCQGNECGPDGCGGLCGACYDGQICVGGQCLSNPTCGAAPNCECIMAECHGGIEDWGGTPQEACEFLGVDPQCEAALVAEYQQRGCPKACNETVFPMYTSTCGPNCPTWAEKTGNACTTCVGCVPICTGKQCGSDGCGGSCGSCEAHEICQGGQCVDEGCGTNPTCECLISKCWGLNNLPVPVDVVCAALGDCKDDIAADYVANGCPDLCGTYGIPNFPSLCTSDNCSELVSVAPGFCSECGGCTPTCNGNTCGPDGCGGFCGFCGADTVCQDGTCASVSTCETTSSCACALTACTDTSLLPLPVESICGFLEATPSCAAAVLGDYTTDGCPDVCQGGDLPLFPSLCTDPACASLSGFMGQACDVCL